MRMQEAGLDNGCKRLPYFYFFIACLNRFEFVNGNIMCDVLHQPVALLAFLKSIQRQYDKHLRFPAKIDKAMLWT